MKKITFKQFLSFVFLLLTLSLATSCSDNDNDYKGINKVYITAEGATSLTIGEEKQVVNATLTLSRKVEVDTPLDIKITDKKGAVVGDIVKISPNPLTIAANSTTLSFTITLADNASLVTAKRLKISIKTQELMAVEKDLEILLKPSLAVQELTEKQLKLLEAYEAKGMNIAQFLGKIKVKTTIVSAADGYTEAFASAFTKELEGTSVITLSEKSTVDQPVLKMTENPMGMTEFFYFIMKKQTIENEEFAYGKWAAPSWKIVRDLINWTKTSEETFSVDLDGINVREAKKGISVVEYMGPGKDSYGDNIRVVPFVFAYTAWDRLKEKVKEGNKEAVENSEIDGTSNPDFYLNKTDITKGGYDGGAFKKTSGSIDYEKGVMIFNFLSSHTYGGDYLVVSAKYSVE